MVFPVPEHSRNRVNRAGQTFLCGAESIEEYDLAIQVLSNWRACHNRPINTFQATLRDKLKQIDPAAIVAQRLKRLPSIINKLERFPGMKLSRMQDIGGLRAVVATLAKVRKLEENYKNSRFKHTLVNEFDYVSSPKESGYRGVHLVYRYQSEALPSYNGLLVELQIRTKLQHIWATAVETAGTFLNQSLKSSQGEEEWLNFFSLVGSAFAHIEKSPLVPGYERLSESETYALVAKESRRLRIKEHLQAFSVAVDVTRKEKSGSFHLVVLDSKRKTVTIQSFGRRRLEEANVEYSRQERRIKGGEPIQVVLVSAGPLDSLRRAYPNYFLDTRLFIARLDTIIDKSAQ